jgi:hypothetical protein
MEAMRSNVSRRLSAIIAATTLVWGGVVIAADGTHWATGTALERTLNEEVLILRVNNPLRKAIRQISQAYHVAILTDRRVDPGQKLDVSLKNLRMKSALQTIADGLGLEVVRLGNVVYLGPAPAAHRLRGVAASLEKDVRRLPSGIQRKYFLAKRLAWEDFAEPRELVAELARDSGLKITGLEKMPYDLWAAADLHPLSLVDRLTLIAIQFDLAVKITDGGRRLTLVSLPSE